MTPAPERPDLNRCRATKPRLDPTMPPKQCPRPAKYGGEWCRQHAESLGGWRLAPPGEPGRTTDHVCPTCLNIHRAAAAVTDAGLREAAKRLDHAFGAMYVGGVWEATQERIDAFNALQDALAAAPVTDAGLDVERLAHAYNNVVVLTGTGKGWTMETWGKVAAEYAALSRQAEKETA